MPYGDRKGVWKGKTFFDRGVHVTQVWMIFKGTKILLEYYNNYNDFFFEVAEGTVDNEPVDTVVIPYKFNNKRYLLMWQHDENIS